VAQKGSERWLSGVAQVVAQRGGSEGMAQTGGSEGWLRGLAGFVSVKAKFMEYSVYINKITYFRNPTRQTSNDPFSIIIIKRPIYEYTPRPFSLGELCREGFIFLPCNN
jgi:hypothetical protein